MKKLFLLLALLGMVATGCSKDEVDKGNDNKTEQPNEDEGGNIPDDAYISLNKEIVTISPDGESVGVKVYSNYAWELTNNCDWITTSITSGDASDTGVAVTLTADLTYDDREGTIVFSCGKAKKLLVVSQKLKEVIIPDANNTFNIPAEGGVAVISYQTSVDCEVIIPEEVQDWITIAPATRGLVNESITLDIAENTTYSARTAVIKVVAKDNAELVIEYTINQEQNDAVLANGNTEFTIDGREQQITIEHKANVDCEVIIADEAQDWVTIAPATRGLSTYTTTLNIAENNSGKERSCVVKVVSKDDNELFAEYTIVQNSRYCLYYTSSNGKIVTPYDSSSFGATIVSNTYKDGVGVIEFDSPITTIGIYAFAECSSLTSVTIPDSVTEIGEVAFAGCSSLERVTIGDSVTTIGEGAFANCSSLTSVTIGNSVTTIGWWAFQDCSSLTSVTIPDSVTTIGDGAFSWCESLTSVTIGNSVTMIGEYAFYNCSRLTSVTIGDSVTTIGWWAFQGCSSLQEFNGKFASEDGRCLIIDGTLNSFAPAGLTEYTIPNSVTTIGLYAFSYCDSLISVTIGDSVTSIGDYAFYGCSSLQEFNGKFASEDGKCLIIDGTLNSFAPAGLTEYTIPDSVTTIGWWAFQDCSSLTSVTIPDSVTTIGGGAFYGCSSLQEFNGKFASEDGKCLIIDGTLNSFAPAGLTEYTIPNSVTSIGDGAFYGCTSLTSVTIPDSVTEIGGYEFYDCSSLTSVYCKAITPPVALFYDTYWYAFWCNASGLKIYVPMESVKEYKSASGWSEYADAIVGYNF